ncbi:hypothetical protein FB107DRAFT_276912 [Schizophyllum commune]
MASDWGFNFRNGYACDSDSSDDDAAPKTETDLIRDFDLGSRDEGGVKYKPNPFSIAKINAAARGEPASKQGGGKSGKTQGRGKPQTKKAGGGTIEHAFKKQAARPRNKAVKEPAAKQAPRSRPFQDPRIDRPTPPPPAQASPPMILATTNAATNPLAEMDAAAFAPTTASTKETAASDAHIPTSPTASTDLPQEGPVLTPTSLQRQPAHIPTFRPRPRIPRLQYNVQSSPLRSQLPRNHAARPAPLSSPAQPRAHQAHGSTSSPIAASRASSRPAVPKGSATRSQLKGSSGTYAGDSHSRSYPAKLDFRRLQAKATGEQAAPARSAHPAAFADKPQILRIRPANKLSPTRPTSTLTTTVKVHPLGRSSAALEASSPPSSVPRKRPVTRAANSSIAHSPSRPPSAYATSFGDADEEWSTLSAPLRPGKRQKVHGVPFTAPFSIPALLGKAGAGASQVKARNASAAKARTGTGIIPRGGTRPPSGSQARDTVRKSGVSPGSRRRVITFLPPPLPTSVASKPVSRSSALNAEERDDFDVLPSVDDADEPRFQFSVDDVGRPRSSSPSYARSSSPTLVGANPRTPVHKDAPYSAYDKDATYGNGSVTMYDAIRPGYDDNFPLRDDNALLYASASHPSDGATCYDDAHLDAHTHYYGAQVRGHDVHAHHYDDYDDADDSMLANIDLEGVRLRFPALKARLRSRKKAVMTMWEKLNLPSFGEVYYDPEGKGGVGEIQVPRWKAAMRELGHLSAH